MIDAIVHDDPDIIEKTRLDNGFFLSCVARLSKSGAVFVTNQEDEYNKT
jgi:hypothetical protein